MITKPDIKWGFTLVIICTYILADLCGRGIIPIYVSTPCCALIGLSAAWVVDHYWNKLVLDLLLKAKDHGIKIITTMEDMRGEVCHGKTN